MVQAIVRRHQELARMRKAYTREKRLNEFQEHLSDIFADRSNSLSDFSVRGLFEALVDDGYELVQYNMCGGSGGGVRLMESAGTVNTSLFANIQGQYLYNAVLRAYEMPELIGDRLVEVIPSRERSERIPGVTAIGDQVEVVKEGDPYPRAITSERWVDMPDTVKRGMMVEITEEVVFHDKTMQILQECSGIGRYIAINRERRILDVVCGISTVYRRNGAAAAATYGSDNTSTSNALVDYTSLDAADTKFMALTDPDNGEPISTTATHLVVPPALRNTANRILNATMTGKWTSSSTNETRVAGNSLNQQVEMLYNQYVKERTSSDTTWFYGAMKMAFVYMQNWPLRVDQEGANGPEAFERDVIARFKASERGVAGVKERLCALKATA